MEEFQKRVVDERDARLAEHARLTEFIGGPIFSGLGLAERRRLSRQSGIMSQLIAVLHERIEAFGVQADDAGALVKNLRDQLDEIRDTVEAWGDTHRIPAQAGVTLAQRIESAFNALDLRIDGLVDENASLRSQLGEAVSSSKAMSDPGVHMRRLTGIWRFGLPDHLAPRGPLSTDFYSFWTAVDQHIDSKTAPPLDLERRQR